MVTRSRVLRALRRPDLVVDYLGTKFRRGREQAVEFATDRKRGVSIMDEDWDNLIILDACRYDVFAEVHEFEGDLTRRQSLGEATPTFIRENFGGRSFYDTIYLTANAMVGECSDDIDVYKLVGLWGDDRRDTRDDNTNPKSLEDPEPLVERALETHRAHPDKRLIVHFLQPHTPFLVKDGERLPPASLYRTFEGVREGRVSNAEIRSVYRENLEYVLSYVDDLVNKLGGKTVLTADHGELLGEGIPWVYRLLHPRWSLTNRHYFDYAHYTHVRVPELVDVPWFEFPYDSRRQIEAATEPAGIEMDESAIESQLEHLGYL